MQTGIMEAFEEPQLDISYYLKVRIQNNTKDVSHKFYSKAKFMGVSFLVRQSVPSLRSFLAVCFPLLSISQLKPNQLN